MTRHPILRVLDVLGLRAVDKPLTYALTYGASAERSGLFERVDEAGCGAVFAAALEPLWEA